MGPHAHQVSLSMGFSRQEYWSGLPFIYPGDILKPGIELGSPALQVDALTSEPSEKPNSILIKLIILLCLPLLYSVLSFKIIPNYLKLTRDLFKKTRDTKGTFHAKMGSKKDRNGIDLTEAEDIKKMWQEYTK